MKTFAAFLLATAAFAQSPQPATKHEDAKSLMLVANSQVDLGSIIAPFKCNDPVTAAAIKSSEYTHVFCRTDDGKVIIYDSPQLIQPETALELEALQAEEQKARNLIDGLARMVLDPNIERQNALVSKACRAAGTTAAECSVWSKTRIVRKMSVAAPVPVTAPPQTDKEKK